MPLVSRLALLSILLFSFVSKADSSCEGLFALNAIQRELSLENILINQSHYLRLFFLRAGERWNGNGNRDKPTLEQIAKKMNTTKHNLYAKVSGKTLMSFKDIILFAKAQDIPIFNVMDYIFELQHRENNGKKFLPIVPIGSYKEIVLDSTLSFEERLQAAQEAHLQRLLQLRAEPLGHTVEDIASSMGMTKPGFGNYIGLYTSHHRISFINALKLAEVLDVDARDVFSFLLDFENIDARTIPVNSTVI